MGTPVPGREQVVLSNFLLQLQLAATALSVARALAMHCCNLISRFLLPPRVFVGDPLFGGSYVPNIGWAIDRVAFSNWYRSSLMWYLFWIIVAFLNKREAPRSAITKSATDFSRMLGSLCTLDPLAGEAIKRNSSHPDAVCADRLDRAVEPKWFVILSRL